MLNWAVTARTDWQCSGTDSPGATSVEITGLVPGAPGYAGEPTSLDPPEDGSNHSHTPGQPPRGGPPN